MISCDPSTQVLSEWDYKTLHDRSAFTRCKDRFKVISGLLVQVQHKERKRNHSTKMIYDRVPYVHDRVLTSKSLRELIHCSSFVRTGDDLFEPRCGKWHA